MTLKLMVRVKQAKIRASKERCGRSLGAPWCLSDTATAKMPTPPSRPSHSVLTPLQVCLMLCATVETIQLGKKLYSVITESLSRHVLLFQSSHSIPASFSAFWMLIGCFLFLGAAHGKIRPGSVLFCLSEEHSVCVCVRTWETIGWICDLCVNAGF